MNVTHLALFRADAGLVQASAPPTPKSRAIEFNERFYNYHGRVNELIGLIERWYIVEPRLNVFRVALAAGMFDLDAANKDYFGLADVSCTERSRWAHRLDKFFGQPVIDQIGSLARAVQVALLQVDCYVLDFQYEMQSLFVGELFDGRVPAR